MAKINWTQEAQNWLKDILDYIALDNSDAATRIENFSFQQIRTGQLESLAERGL